MTFDHKRVYEMSDRPNCVVSLITIPNNNNMTYRRPNLEARPSAIFEFIWKYIFLEHIADEKTMRG